MKKHLFLKSLLIAIGLLIASINTAWAEKSIWEWKLYYYDGSADRWLGGDNNTGDLDFGIVNSNYWWKGAWAKTADNNSNSVTVYYVQPNGSQYNFGLTYQNCWDNCWNKWWKNESGCNHQLTGSSFYKNNPGVNTIQFYVQIDGENKLTPKATYTIPGFTTTSTSQTFDNTTVSSNSSKTISFGKHYGTTLTTSNCALSGTNKSEFEVTGISETGVTVKFKPTTDGNKSATLTITDAHSKTCTIALSGTTRRKVTYKHGDYTTGSDITAYKVYGSNLTLRNSGDFNRTGYTHTAWNTSSNGTSGTSYALGATYSTNSTLTLYPTWAAKQSAITLDYQTSVPGYSSSGNITNAGSLTGTYDSPMTALTGTMPSALSGYVFMGFYSGVGGTGTKYYNANGSSANNWAENTTDGTTLYAHWKKVEITALTLVDAIVAPDVADAVKVTPTVEPTPTETTHMDWRVLYSNGNPLSPQPAMTTYNTTGKQFKSPETPGAYLIEAVLRTGSIANAGTTIDSTTVLFHVAGNHTVTVQYKDADGATIAASTSVTGKPLAWSDGITAPDIFGYTFARWDAGDGVTIKNGDSDPVTTSTNATIQIKAVYDGRLTAVYNKKQMIYFKNTLGWGGVYVNFMTQSYWNAYNGSGNGNNYYSRNNQMSLVPGTTDVYYYEYSGSSTAYVSFTSKSQANDNNFWASDASGNVAVCYPTKYNDSGDENSYYGLNWGTPMFVPLSDQTPIKKNTTNNGGAYYYNKGYWRYYDPVNGEEGATGYTLKIYNKPEDDGRVELSSTTFTNADVTGQLFKATVNLEAAGGYGVKILRNNSMLYTDATGHLQRTGDVVVTDRQNDNYKAIWIKATAAGDYDFIITCDGDGKICLQATFPAKEGDYRVLYTDNATWSNSAHTARTWFHPSRVISAEGGAEDTISFYVAKDNSPQYKIEKVKSINETTGAITWTKVQDWTGISVAATGVYNFKITQNAAGDGISSVTNIGEYTGNYYIRTDCAGSTKWDNYKTADHMMTYSEYSKEHSDYTHYYMKFVESGMNVKFCIANDYSGCISDTLITHNYRGGDASHVYDSDGVGYKKGDIKAAANIRFMWDIRYNRLIRAYLARGKNDGSEFLVLRANSNTDMLDKDGNALLNSANSGQAGYNHKAPDNCMQFVDNENWIYEANIKIKPGAFVKLYAKFNNSYFYFKGENNNTFDKDNAIKLMDGTGDAELVRVIYDFKTDRLVAAWQPSGEISGERAIHADVMFVREHQGDIAQLTFTEGGAITEINTAYAVLRFNKWTINNKSKADGHAPLSPLLSRYERDLFHVSFPFRVSMNEVFGFGTYGKHWIIEEYDGATRAEKGYWAESGSNWKFIWDRKGKFFEPNQGYIIALELDEMGEKSDVWANGVQNVELYFPSYGSMPTITNSTVNCTIPEHQCNINRSAEIGGDGQPLGPAYDRRVKDSHWNVISVPTYVNTNNASYNNTSWITTVGPEFLYEWNSADNSVTARSYVGYTYKAMHAYLVQYCGRITWTTSVSPTAAPRRNSAYRGNYEFRLEILQNDEAVDQTFVKLSDNEAVTTEFEFNYDMIKEFNKNRSNIYTLIGTEPAAGNVLPLTDQTTVVPVGVIAKTDGDYTFSIPDGTEGIGVTLIDNETGIRTSLSAVDYTINLSAGTYDDRFLLEISPIKHVATGIETVNEEGVATNGARKIMIDGLLYIVKDGKVFDAQGRQVK